MDERLTAEERVERDLERLRNAPTIHELPERERKRNEPTWGVRALGFGQILGAMLVIPLILRYVVPDVGSGIASYWGLGIAGVISLWIHSNSRTPSRRRD